METLLAEILERLKETDCTDDTFLDMLIHKHNRNLYGNDRHHSKKKLLPYYLEVKKSDPLLWARWNIDQNLEDRLFRLLRVKPRRTASGVSTITVITKPWKCFSDCLYCPNDIRMPKSYLHNEPACQRAERNYFDPYLQLSSRLRTLTEMGHNTAKIELIILGGSWSDYPIEYQVWFVKELFKALNDEDDGSNGANNGADNSSGNRDKRGNGDNSGNRDSSGSSGSREQNCKKRRQFYEKAGFANNEQALTEFAKETQRKLNDSLLTYNQAVAQLYGDNDAWKTLALEQVSDFETLIEQQRINEQAPRRVVGLVIETRPDAINAENLTLFRKLGCTKVQIGVQSLNPAILKANNRNISPEKIREAFELLRIFGLKIHAHFMLNLYGATAEADKDDYRRFVSEPAYLPDEIKLYPCALIGGTKLCRHYEDKSWRPYDEDELLDVLVTDTLNTPPFIRISRMIRDFSADDILAGNKKTNLRQFVENRIEELGKRQNVSEIRYREIGGSNVDINSLDMETIPYKTTVTDEYFLQWVTPENRIAGFLRLSLPDPGYLLAFQEVLPVKPYEAMIREVHIYGKVAELHKAGEGAQHLGLGRKLIEAAVEIAKTRGYTRLNVISAVGTREYYRSLGFSDGEFYQQMPLSPPSACDDGA